MTAYHRGLMAGRTPNIDQVAEEGMLFVDYYALALRNNYIPSHAHQLGF